MILMPLQLNCQIFRQTVRFFDTSRTGSASAAMLNSLIKTGD